MRKSWIYTRILILISILSFLLASTSITGTSGEKPGPENLLGLKVGDVLFYKITYDPANEPDGDGHLTHDGISDYLRYEVTGINYTLHSYPDLGDYFIVRFTSHEKNASDPGWVGSGSFESWVFLNDSAFLMSASFLVNVNINWTSVAAALNVNSPWGDSVYHPVANGMDYTINTSNYQGFQKIRYDGGVCTLAEIYNLDNQLYLRVEKLDNSPADGGVGAKHLVPDGYMRNNINVGESMDVNDGFFQINFRGYSFSIPNAKVSSEMHGLSDNTMAVSSNFSNPVASSPDPSRIAVLIHGVHIASKPESGSPKNMIELMGQLKRLETRDGKKYYDKFLNFGYDSNDTWIRDIAKQLTTFIDRYTNEGDIIDIYGFSFGGIVARTFIKYYWNNKNYTTHDVNIEYVFTMGTPNRGIYVNMYSPEYYIDYQLVGEAVRAVIRPIAPLIPPDIIEFEKPSFIKNSLGTSATHIDIIYWTAIRGDGGLGKSIGGVISFYYFGWSAIIFNGVKGDNVVPTARCILDNATENVLLDVDHGGTKDINTIVEVLDVILAPEVTPVFSDAGFLLAILSSLLTSMLLLLMVSFIRHEPRAKHK
ncbi:MAG: esterase/lipase family protein [Promethearchaeota archaeon]